MLSEQPPRRCDDCDFFSSLYAGVLPTSRNVIIIQWICSYIKPHLAHASHNFSAPHSRRWQRSCVVPATGHVELPSSNRITTVRQNAASAFSCAVTDHTKFRFAISAIAQHAQHNDNNYTIITGQSKLRSLLAARLRRSQ